MPPVTLLIKPASGHCNMRCRYCFYADVQSLRAQENLGMMEPDTMRCMVKRAFEYADKSAAFCFQGGEPTLAGLDYYRQFVETVRQHNLKKLAVSYSIQTNGLTIDDEWADFLAANRFLVGLSLDGTKQIHDGFRPDAAGKGTYMRVIEAARRLQRKGVEFNILCVVNAQTARHGAQVYRSLRDQGFRFLQFIPCLDSFEGPSGIHSLTPERYGTFLKAVFDCYYDDYMKGTPVSVRLFDNYIRVLAGLPPEECGMMGVCTGYFVVEGDGGVYPCDFYVLDEWKMGSVQEHSLKELWNGQVRSRFHEQSLAKDEGCLACRWYPLCRGGCRRYREPSEYAPSNRNRNCQALTALFEHAYPRMEQMARMQRSGFSSGNQW